MRSALTLAVCVMSLAVGLATALLQSANRAEGIALDRIVQECSMVETVNESRMADVLAHDLGPEGGETVEGSE